MADICLNHAEHIKKFDQQGLINSDFEKRISGLEIEVRVNKMEQGKDIEQINGKLDDILVIIKTNQSRLPNLVWGIAGSLGGGVAVWVILQILQK